MTILKTPQAAAALGCSVSYLKRQRDTQGGFLELGKHYHRMPTSNAAITWDVDLIRAEMNKRARDWELPPFFLGNRFPRKKENVCECRIPLPEESVALAQLAEQASQCDSPEDLEIPAVLQKFF